MDSNGRGKDFHALFKMPYVAWPFFMHITVPQADIVQPAVEIVSTLLVRPCNQISEWVGINWSAGRGRGGVGEGSFPDSGGRFYSGFELSPPRKPPVHDRQVRRCQWHLFTGRYPDPSLKPWPCTRCCSLYGTHWPSAPTEHSMLGWGWEFGVVITMGTAVVCRGKQDQREWRLAGLWPTHSTPPRSGSKSPDRADCFIWMDTK